MRPIKFKCKLPGTPEQRARFMANLKRTREASINARNARKQPSFLAPGVYTQTITGHPCDIDARINAHHTRMYNTYNGYAVLNTTSVALPDGVCFYITYQIGTPRCAGGQYASYNNGYQYTGYNTGYGYGYY